MLKLKLWEEEQVVVREVVILITIGINAESVSDGYGKVVSVGKYDDRLELTTEREESWPRRNQKAKIGSYVISYKVIWSDDKYTGKNDGSNISDVISIWTENFK